MIDWITFRAPLAHQMGEGGPFWRGSIISTVPDPETGEAIDWQTLKRCPVEGSYSSTITVQSTDMDGRPALWVSGCPAKWFQGQNVHGSDDLAGLVREMLARICRSLNVQPSADDLADWEAGNIDLTRVDVTYSWDFGTLPRARAAIRSLAATAHLRHRGPGVFKGDTLYFGKTSTRWALKVYAKGGELKARPLPLDLAESSLPRHADGLVRLELCLRSKVLKALPLEGVKLSKVAGWGDTTAPELHRHFLKSLEISEATMLDAHQLDTIPKKLHLTYQAWKDGHDLRAILPRRTFYRHRSELLKCGIDIAVKQDRDDYSNVVPLRTVLIGQPATVPDWMVGTKWYFEPRAKVA